MTLRDLEDQGLLILPTQDTWKPEFHSVSLGSVSELQLTYVQMWGMEGRDDGIFLCCQDNAGRQYTAEIEEVSECLSRYFMSSFFAAHYDENITAIFSATLEIDRKTVPIFAREFVHIGFESKRCHQYSL
jgi:hypothetical protein